MELYRQDPSRDVTFNDARQGLDGDVNEIRRVYEFLVNWGLINWRDGDGTAGQNAPGTLLLAQLPIRRQANGQGH